MNAPMFGLARWQTICRDLRRKAAKRLAVLGLFAAAACVNANVAHAQINTGTNVPRPFDSRDADLPRNPDLERKLERARETERQKRIVDGTQRLLELTAQYRKAVEAHASVTAEDEKLLLQIEKLARDVKDRTRGM